ncbi:unnamed protein product [Scytosiphon promiscuus]
MSRVQQISILHLRPIDKHLYRRMLSWLEWESNGPRRKKKRKGLLIVQDRPKSEHLHLDARVQTGEGMHACCTRASPLCIRLSCWICPGNRRAYPRRACALPIDPHPTRTSRLGPTYAPRPPR